MTNGYYCTHSMQDYEVSEPQLVCTVCGPRAARNERALIIAWLRSNPVEVALMRTVAALADAIESGRHLPKESDERG